MQFWIINKSGQNRGCNHHTLCCQIIFVTLRLPNWRWQVYLKVAWEVTETRLSEWGEGNKTNDTSGKRMSHSMQYHTCSMPHMCRATHSDISVGIRMWAGEVDQPLRALTAIPEDPQRTKWLTSTYNSSFRTSSALFWHPGLLHTGATLYTRAHFIYIYICMYK